MKDKLTAWMAAVGFVVMTAMAWAAPNFWVRAIFGNVICLVGIMFMLKIEDLRATIRLQTQLLDSWVNHANTMERAYDVGSRLIDVSQIPEVADPDRPGSPPPVEDVS